MFPVRSLAMLLMAAFASHATVVQADPQPPLDLGFTETVTVYGHPLTAVNFQRPGGWGTHVPLVATSRLAPDARGRLDIDAKHGYVQIESTSWGLPPAASFGDEFATYVLWAITPDGYASNLGEILVDRKTKQSRLEVTTSFPAFALFVTAEPDFAVGQPSEVVVLHGVPNSTAAGRRETVRPRQTMIVSGAYDFQGHSRSDVDARSGAAYLIQAKNARRIATDLGAAESAPAVLERAEALLARATASKDEAQVVTLARQATQAFEDARLVTAQRRAVRIVMTEAPPADGGGFASRLAELFETRETPCGLVATMPDLLFDFDGSTLRPVARDKLDRLAALLEESSGLDLTVEGHADSVGSERYNQGLSERRARAVRDHLIGRGVAQRTISAMGRGELRPVASNATHAGRALNRRVEILISSRGTAVGQ